MTADRLTLTRGRAGQVAGYVGVAGLIMGLIAAVASSGASWSLTIVGLGIVGILVWAALAPREFTGFITGRSARYGTVTVMSTLLLVGIVALVYLLLARNAVTLDMTETQRFSLSPETLRVLARISQPMQITGFYSPANLPLREVDDQFFRLYEVATNGLIQREYVDPEEQPAQAQRFGVQEDGQVYLSFLNDDGTIDFSSLARVPRGSNQERDMTESIARALIAGSLTIYFDQGNGERDPLDASAEGLSGINNGARESGLITQPLNVRELAATGGQIPANASAVIFARPLEDLTDAEIGVLQTYLARGGSLMLMADILFNANPFMRQDGAFNTYLWNTYGIRALDAAIVDPLASGQNQLDVISAVVFPENDIGTRLDPAAGTPTLFRVARAVQVDIDRSLPNIANGRVITSSEGSYGETNLTALGDTNTYEYEAGADLPGPLDSVVWAWDQGTDARILLIGDSDFVTNGLILSGGNAILFTDGISWLTRLRDEINFAPQAYNTGLPLVFLSQQQLDVLTFVAVILLPGAVLVSGIAIGARRRRQT